MVGQDEDCCGNFTKRVPEAQLPFQGLEFNSSPHWRLLDIPALQYTVPAGLLEITVLGTIIASVEEYFLDPKRKGNMSSSAKDTHVRRNRTLVIHTLQ
jgi:hypothetical protein